MTHRVTTVVWIAPMHAYKRRIGGVYRTAAVRSDAHALANMSRENGIRVHWRAVLKGESSRPQVDSESTQKNASGGRIAFSQRQHVGSIPNGRRTGTTSRRHTEITYTFDSAKSVQTGFLSTQTTFSRRASPCKMLLSRRAVKESKVSCGASVEKC